MKAEDLAKAIEAQFSEEDLRAIEKMSDEERKELLDFLNEEVATYAKKVKAKADELVALAKGEGVNVDGSKGVQFLIGAVAGCIVNIDRLSERLNKIEKHLEPKIWPMK